MNSSYLNILRQLADQQQFSLLRDSAQQYVSESADIQALPLQAMAHAHLGEHTEAQTILEKIQDNIAALELDAQVDLAAVYCLLQQVDQALLLLESAQATAPKHPLLLARLAWCRMTQGKFDLARELYQQAAILAPARLPVWSALIQLLIQEGDLDLAQQALTNAITQLELCHSQLPDTVVCQFTAQFRGLQLQIWLEGEALDHAEQWLIERRANIEEDDWVALLLSYATLLAGKNHHASADEILRDALQYYPKNLSLFSQLIELAQVQGRSQQAIQLLRRAITLAKALDKPTVVFLVRLSSACLHHNEDRARDAAVKAVTEAETLQVSDKTPPQMINQWQLQAQSAMAQVESQQQNFAQAEALFKQILQQNPYFVPALQGLGQQQLQRGFVDQAVALFERIKQIDPAKGYASLINARQFPEDEFTLRQIEKAARQPSIEGSLRSGLLLQLALTWEKHQDFDKAFKLANEANTGAKKILNYNAKQHRTSSARIRHAFSKSLFEHRPQRGIDSSLPVFVVGMPRSGTTLVEQILAGHSEIFGAGELGVIPSRIAGLNRWERHVGSGRHYPDCIDDVTPDVSAGIANGILEELKALAFDDKAKAKHVVDKLPHNFENIGLIKFLFPQAKIISVRRDPRDIAISNFFTDYQAKHGGMGFAYDLTHIGEQLADHNMMMHHWQQLFPGEILQINYEDVVGDLEGSARKMLDYIGVEWQDQVLAFNELDRPVKTASVWQVRQPIYQTSKAKWKRYQKHLAPLLKGTNTKICPDPITDMLTLPEPGFLTDGVASYKKGDLDEAERSFKKMLHHNPQHAACHYMLGLVYLTKNHPNDGILALEKALEIAPWQQKWRDDLCKAYQLTDKPEKAEYLQAKRQHTAVEKGIEYAT